METLGLAARGVSALGSDLPTFFVHESNFALSSRKSLICSWLDGPHFFSRELRWRLRPAYMRTWRRRR